MSFNLTDISMQRLSTCHPDLVRLISEVAKIFPLNVLCGYRNETDQNAAVSSGHSKTPWPSSKHNKLPSLAVDVEPQGYNPGETHRLVYLAGFVVGIASTLNVSVRWGGDFDMDFSLLEPFQDLFHFEIEQH